MINEDIIEMFDRRKLETTAKSVEVRFEETCHSSVVTLCDAELYDHDQHQCRDIVQETCTRDPVLSSTTPAVTVKYPEPVLFCAELHISVPKIQCQVREII